MDIITLYLTMLTVINCDLIISCRKTIDNISGIYDFPLFTFFVFLTQRFRQTLNFGCDVQNKCIHYVNKLG